MFVLSRETAQWEFRFPVKWLGRQKTCLVFHNKRLAGKGPVLDMLLVALTAAAPLCWVAVCSATDAGNARGDIAREPSSGVGERSSPGERRWEGWAETERVPDGMAAKTGDCSISDFVLIKRMTVTSAWRRGLAM